MPFELLSEGDLAAIKAVKPQLLKALQEGTLLPQEKESIETNTGEDS